uniref:Uncharacterized protein n=1 Tax=Corethron hystrix TaxID=216773 RepID=A0A7S1BT29_9STRA|mmetsp:Transcript_37475/g.87396  ORF Transcript_37475/g.87396 Transcript_37475/m.87396 type:complete len:217 (+) Transcript_37475:138-788(+)
MSKNNAAERTSARRIKPIREIIMRCNNDLTINIPCTRGNSIHHHPIESDGGGYNNKDVANKVKRRDVSDLVNPFLHLAMCGRLANAVDDSEIPYYGSVVGGISGGGLSSSRPEAPLSPHVLADPIGREQNEKKKAAAMATIRPLWTRMSKNMPLFPFAQSPKNSSNHPDDNDSDDGSIGLNDLHPTEQHSSISDPLFGDESEAITDDALEEVQLSG